jgi:tol-pal system protein YbgF
VSGIDARLTGSGGRGATPVRRALRVLAPLGLVALVTGCAMKSDIRDLRDDLARQDATLSQMQAQNRQIMDTLAVTTDRLLDVRGEMANQLAQLREQMIEMSELTAQVQLRLNQLDQQLSRAVRDVADVGLPGAPGQPGQTGQPGQPGQPGDPGGDTFSMAHQFYEIGLEQLERGNAATARRAFQSVVDSFPADPRAPDAQRQIGESLAMEQSFDEALRAFDRVVERYPDSDAAPRSLYRAGVISQERGNLERARQYFQRVISGYPGSDARRLAEEALARLSR